MSFFTRFNPAGGIADFWHEFRRPNPYRWPILIISCLLTGIMIWSFTRERVYLPPDLPKVTFINTFPEGRSIDEIRASNIENQRRKEKLEAEQAARDEAARDAYRALGRASGMDVDAIDRKVAADEARKAAADKARLEKFIAPRSDASAEAPVAD